MTKITDLQLVSSVTDGLNFPSDNGIQSYRATALQVRDYVSNHLLGPNVIPGTALQSGVVTNPNWIINGNFDSWLRGASFSVSSSKYAADRFFEGCMSSTAAVSRVLTVGMEPFQATAYKRNTITSVAGAGNFFITATRLENIRELAGKTVTLSFHAKADTNRYMSIEFVQNFGTGGSPSTEVNSIGVTKLALTSSWQRFTVTATLPSISGKTIGSNENNYTGINFWFDAGSSFNSRTSSLGQQSGTFDLSGVKLEEGAIATPFILHGGSTTSDLNACYRYYQAHSLVINCSYTRSFLGASWMLPVSMRGAPTVAWYDNAGTQNRVSSNNSNNITLISGYPIVNYKTLYIDANAGAPADTWWRFYVFIDAEL